MLESGVINRFQLWLLIVNFTVGSALLLIPSAVAVEAKQDAWFAMLLATVTGMFLTFIMVTLANFFPDLTLVAIAQKLLGKPIGKLIGLLYAWFSLHLCALVIRNAVDFIKSVVMPETPMLTFILMAAFLTFLTVFHGLETIARSNQLFSPFAMIGFWLTVFLIMPLMKGENIQPFFAEGVKPVLRGAFPVLGFPFAELVVFLMILPFINNRKRLKLVFISGTLVGGFSLTVITLACILVLGVTPTALSIFAPFNVARLINIGDFLTRIETIIALAFLIGIYAKIIVTFYAGTLAVTQVFNLSDYRPVIIPLLIITATLSLILDRNIVEEFNFAATTWAPYGLLFGFVIPLFLLVISFMKKLLL